MAMPVCGVLVRIFFSAVHTNIVATPRNLGTNVKVNGPSTEKVCCAHGPCSVSKKPSPFKSNHILVSVLSRIGESTALGDTGCRIVL